jgi:aldehyde dehydrogenase (NAD+)
MNTTFMRGAFRPISLPKDMTGQNMFIAGEWCDAEDGATAEVIDPSCNEVIATTPKATIADVDRCVTASRAALSNKSWALIDPAERGRILQRMAQATYANAKTLAALESQNNGKTFREALSEIRYGAWTLEYFAGLADKVEGSTIPVPGNRLNYSLRQPLGVTVHIVPWNFPLQLALRSIAPAIASGCTVIAKPASWTPLSLIAWLKAMQEAEVGLPDDVIQVITGSGGLIGDALAGHSGVDGIVLTGGVSTGQAVMAKASENLTPVTLELGGKGANVVFADANLGFCAKAICYGIFMNAGQMCWAGSRLIVHEDVHDELVEAIVAEISKWKVGPGMEEGVRMGSLVHRSHRDEVLSLLEKGLEHGGKVVLGGNALLGDGAFMEATVVIDVDIDNPLFNEELFGPVLAVSKFSEDKEALIMANNSEFGLLNGVWTNDLSRAHKMARDLQSGMVSINEYPITFPQTAFTGWKKSGIGVEQSQDAMRFYTKVKNVNVKL